MISVTLDQLYGWINGLLWPLARVLALLGTAPLFGESGIPVKAKLGLGVLLTIAVGPALGPMPDIPAGSFASMWIIAQQVLIGVALGFTMKLAFAAVQTAGEFIGLQMGLSFASFFDPGTNSSTSVLSRLMNMIAILVFLAMDGHLLILSGLVHSFQVLPIADAQLSRGGLGVLIDWSAQVLILGLVMALPLITALLTMNLAMGILNRTAPQLSVFAVGFPISLLAGLLMLAIVLPQSSSFFERLFTYAFDAFGQVTEGFLPQ